MVKRTDSIGHKLACAGWIGSVLESKSYTSFTERWALPNRKTETSYQPLFGWSAYLLILDLLKGKTPLTLDPDKQDLFILHHLKGLESFGFSD